MATRKIDLEQAFTRNAVELADRYLELLALRVEVERAELITSKALGWNPDRDSANGQSETKSRRTRSIRRSLVLLAMTASMVGTPVFLGASPCRSIGQHARSPLRRLPSYSAGVPAS